MTTQNQEAAGQAAGAGGGPARQTDRAPVVNIKDVDAAIRHQLQRGVDFGQRRLAVSLFEPDITWIKVDEAGYVMAIYVKGQVGVTVHAKLHNNGGDVEIVSASLGCLCGCRDGRVGGP